LMSPSSRLLSDPPQGGPEVDDARARILRAAYDLFCRNGVQATGVDRIIADAGVAKMTLYRHFGSKTELVLAALALREELWTRGWLEREVRERGGTATAQLLAIFEAFDEWFRRDDYESCLFTTALLESHDRRAPIGAAATSGLAEVRAFLRDLAEEAGARDPDELARRLQILMLGSIVAATAGDVEAAVRARAPARAILEQEGIAL
jgi:AcrR family transcriptional regulator